MIDEICRDKICYNCRLLLHKEHNPYHFCQACYINNKELYKNRKHEIEQITNLISWYKNRPKNLNVNVDRLIEEIENILFPDF